MAAKTMAEANRLIRRLPEEVRLEVQQVADVTAFRFVQMVQPQIPTGTGVHHWQDVTQIMHLKDTVQWRRRGVGAVVGVAIDAFYWKFLEFGTIHITPRRWFRQTAAALSFNHKQRMGQALQRARNKVTG